MFKTIERLHFANIESTNTWAKQHVSKLDPDRLTLITASEQTGGRGRFNRKWHSPLDQNIYATYCFSVPNGWRNLSNISQVLAISAAQVLKEFAFNVKLKWPNDLLLNEKKIGGLLCETLTIDERLWLFLGIGLNVNMPFEYLNQIDQPATSLLAQTGKQHEIESILSQLSKQFIEHLNCFVEKGFSPFLGIYRDLICYQPMQRLSYWEGSSYIEGTYDSIDEEGALHLCLDDGSMKKVVAGDVHLIRSNSF